MPTPAIVLHPGRAHVQTVETDRVVAGLGDDRRANAASATEQAQEHVIQDAGLSLRVPADSFHASDRMRASICQRAFVNHRFQEATCSDQCS
jgi:hypothetical protein